MADRSEVAQDNCTLAISKLLDLGFNHKIRIDSVNQALFKEESFAILEPNGLCLSSKLAIDFDRTKKLLQLYSNKDGFKSADGLKIFPEDKRIDFIEIKTFKKMFEYQISDDSNPSYLKGRIKDFNLKKKINDSLTLLFIDLIHLNPFSFTGEEREAIKTTTINYYVVTDVERGTFESFAASMRLLSSMPNSALGSLSFNLLSTHLKEIDLTRSFVEISDIKLISFKDLETFY